MLTKVGKEGRNEGGGKREASKDDCNDSIKLLN